jgi:GT2 family glycosyltransferase
VAVVIVGRDAAAYVKQCVQSLARADWDGYTHEIVYVDNGSRDGSVEMLRAGFPEVKTIANPDNRGFCKAANQGAAVTGCRQLFFLNDDTIVLDDAIARLARLLDERPEAGAVGSRLLYPDFTEQWSGRRFPSPWNAVLGRRSALSRLLPNAKPLVDYLYKDRIQGGTPFEVDWVSAAAILVRADVFREVGGFAEDYYYWHEAVFCDRIRKAGRLVFLEPRSRIIHFEGKGSGARPYPLRRWHILNFHLGAYRCYCEHHRLGRLSPRRALAAVGLGGRALGLLAASRVGSFFESRPAGAAPAAPA